MFFCNILLRLVKAVPQQGYRRPITEYQIAERQSETSLSDGYPFLLTNTSSLADLNSKIAQKDASNCVEMNRFRPNIVVEALTLKTDKFKSAWAEDRWKKIQIGNEIFHVVKPCARCSVTTIDQETATKPSGEPAASLREIRRGTKEQDFYFGWNLIQEKCGGTIKVGDKVAILETRAENHEMIPTMKQE